MKKMLMVLAVLAATLPASAGVRLGFYGGPYYGPVYGYGPYYGYYPGTVITAHPNSGEVKFDTKDKGAQVFVNGAFAGTVADLKKTLWLRQGNYDLELRAANGADLHEQVFVASGKTLHFKLGA